MNDIQTLIRTTVKDSPDGDPLGVAVRVIRSVKKDDLLPLVTEAVRHAQRDMTRGIEKTWRSSAARQLRESRRALPSSSEGTAALMDGLSGMLARSFRLGDGSAPVRWGSATVDQHRQRIAMLIAQRDGIDATVERHQEAIEMLEHSGEASLDDVFAAVSAA